MTFGLTAESREILRRMRRLRGSAAVPAESSPEACYLPAEAAGDALLSDLIRKWSSGAKVLRDLSGGEPESGGAVWDCIALGRTCHYKEQMGLLCRARKLLRDGGRLIFAGEYLRDVASIFPSSLPTEFSLLQLSGRLGFRLLETIDWTDAARRSVADALALVAASGPTSRFPPAAWLRSLLPGCRGSPSGAPPGENRKLARELDALAAELDSGHRRFECFVFELDARGSGPWSELDLGDINSFEAEEIAGIFEESFGAKFDPAVWRWKYGAGKGTCIVARAESGGPVIAHYGGVTREIDYFGEDQLAFQGCDVMVKPTERRQYGRNSLYFHMTATLFEREIGYTVDHVLGFGFPNLPVMKTAVRLGLYGKVDDYVELAFGDFPGSYPDLQVEPLKLQEPQHAKSADELWQAMRRDFGGGVIGKRHGQYLGYRYFRHPNADAYFPLLVSRKGEAFAVAVLKRHEERWLLMDVVAPLARMDDIVLALRHWAKSSAAPGALRMWLTKAWVEHLSWRDCIEKNLGIEIPCNVWNPGPDSALPDGAWWLTAGDMDFM